MFYCRLRRWGNEQDHFRSFQSRLKKFPCCDAGNSWEPITHCFTYVAKNSALLLASPQHNNLRILCPMKHWSIFFTYKVISKNEQQQDWVLDLPTPPPFQCIRTSLKQLTFLSLNQTHTFTHTHSTLLHTHSLFFWYTLSPFSLSHIASGVSFMHWPYALAKPKAMPAPHSIFIEGLTDFTPKPETLQSIWTRLRDRQANVSTRADSLIISNSKKKQNCKELKKRIKRRWVVSATRLEECVPVF